MSIQRPRQDLKLAVEFIPSVIAVIFEVVENYQHHTNQSLTKEISLTLFLIYKMHHRFPKLSVESIAKLQEGQHNGVNKKKYMSKTFAFDN